MKTSEIAHDESEELREDMAAEERCKKERFVMDTESGFVMDRKAEEWLTTAEEVYLAMVEELERWKKENSRLREIGDAMAEMLNLAPSAPVSDWPTDEQIEAVITAWLEAKVSA